MESASTRLTVGISGRSGLMPLVSTTVCHRSDWFCATCYTYHRFKIWVSTQSVYTCGPRNLKTTIQVIELMFLRCSDSASQWTWRQWVSLVELHLIECKLRLSSCKLSLIPSSMTSARYRMSVTPYNASCNAWRDQSPSTVQSWDHNVLLSSGWTRSWCLLLRISRTPCTMFSLYMIRYFPLLMDRIWEGQTFRTPSGTI